MQPLFIARTLPRVTGQSDARPLDTIRPFRFVAIATSGIAFIALVLLAIPALVMRACA